jgi:membrane-bound lytic murein transglycosylase A
LSGRGWLRSGAVAAIASLAACAGIAPPSEQPAAPPTATLTRVEFAELPGWGDDDPREALRAFQRSCERFATLPPDEPVGGHAWAGPARHWVAACTEAAAVADDPQRARSFLEARFTAWSVAEGTRPEGLITGYYEPRLRGSRRPVPPFLTPLLRRPDDLIEVDLAAFSEDLRGRRIAGRVEGGRLVPYPDRAEIENGALDGRGLELAWVDDPVDRFFLEIQGSGRVLLDDGQELRVGYAAQNGRPYRAIGRDLVAMGAIPKDQVSMQSIRRWLEANPERARAIMHRNPSFVFFTELEGLAPEDGPLGALGVPLTAGRSLAVDRRHLPLGALLWLETTLPGAGEPTPLRRLVVAQDVGGAITGVVRGDLFVGTGDEAGEVAGRMRQTGRLWILVPNPSPEPMV